MPKIFISYRRDDSMVFAGRICDRLASHFGKDSVFMDVDSIPFGVDFRQHLTDAVSGCDVFLALIGEAWLTANQNGQRRIDDPRDFVRIEIEAALQRGIPVIPVLLGRTAMPREEYLPKAIASLAYRHAAEIDAGRDFHSHMDRLIRSFEKDLLAKSKPHDRTVTEPWKHETGRMGMEEIVTKGNGGSEASTTATKLYVGNLPYDITALDLGNLFEQCGFVMRAEIILDRDTGRSKGFGFAYMRHLEDAEAAIESLNDKEYNGQKIIVSKARPRLGRGGGITGKRRY